MSEKIKVLMVDDEERFRSTTRKILDKKGFETILAQNGEEAINMLTEKPDVVILDIMMPGMDGHEALKEIKNRHPDLPVIMLTGHGHLSSAEKALSGGAFDYLTKPCDINILSAKIKEAYNLREHTDHEEKRILDAMIPIHEYTILDEEQTIRDAIFILKESFASKISTSRLMETGHRSILVMDAKKNVSGILAITDLMQMIMPKYLSAPKPSMADTIAYSPMFWRGMFSREVKQKAGVKIGDVMSPVPLSIDGMTNLMEAAYMMLENNARRLLVTVSGEVAGIIREQDLFFEMEIILNE